MKCVIEFEVSQDEFTESDNFDEAAPVFYIKVIQAESPETLIDEFLNLSERDDKPFSFYGITDLIPSKTRLTGCWSLEEWVDMRLRESSEGRMMDEDGYYTYK